MRSVLSVLIGISACFMTVNGSAYAQDQSVDWRVVDEILGRKPAVTEDVYRYGFPRTDLTVALDRITVKPALALGGWIAFKPAHDGVMAMGDLVLVPTVNPILLAVDRESGDASCSRLASISARPAWPSI